MLNKDKRSMALSLLLGDGSIGVYKVDRYKTGRLTIDHGIEQADYQSWKALLLSEIFNTKVKMYSGHNGKSIQVQVRNKKVKAWRKFCYPGNRKSLPRILKFINNPYFAIAVWLMDDGYVQPSLHTTIKGEKKNYGASFRIFTSTQTDDEMQQIKEWLDSTFKINCRIAKHKDSRQQKIYPLIKILQIDALKIWKEIRDFVLQFRSMKYKFRYIEQIYQLKNAQRTLDSPESNDIVDK